MRIIPFRRFGRRFFPSTAVLVFMVATSGLSLVLSLEGALAAPPRPLTCSILPQDGTADVGVPIAFSVLTDGGVGDKSYAWTFSGPASPSSSTRRSQNVSYGTSGTFRVALQVSDDSGECAASTNVTVRLAPNVPPVANDDSYDATEEQTLIVEAPGVLGNDTGTTATLTAVVETDASKGTLVLNPDGSFTYAYAGKGPFPDTDRFTYQAEDDFAQFSNSATVMITISKSGVPGGAPPGGQQ
jgi:hypothetical protein